MARRGQIGGLSVLFVLAVVARQWCKERVYPPPPKICQQEMATYVAQKLIETHRHPSNIRHVRALVVQGNDAIAWTRTDVIPLCVAFRFTSCTPLPEGANYPE